MQWVIEQIGLRWISELTQSPQPSPGSMMIDPKPEKVFKGWYPDWAAQNYPDGAPRESALSYGKSEKPPDFSLSKFSVHLIFQGLPRRHTPLDLPWPQVLTCAIWSVLLWPSTLFCKRKKGGAVLAPGNSWGWDKRLGREWVRRVWGWRGWGEGGRGFRDPQPQGRKKWGFCSEDSGTMFPLLVIYTPGLMDSFTALTVLTLSLPMVPQTCCLLCLENSLFSPITWLLPMHPSFLSWNATWNDSGRA